MRRPGRHRPDQVVAMRRNPWSPSPECAKWPLQRFNLGPKVLHCYTFAFSSRYRAHPASTALIPKIRILIEPPRPTVPQPAGTRKRSFPRCGIADSEKQDFGLAFCLAGLALAAGIVGAAVGRGLNACVSHSSIMT